MAHCFNLTRKGDTAPSRLWDIDRCICQHMDMPWSEEAWVCYWYNWIGLCLAAGLDFNKIIDMCWHDERYDLLRVAAYLNEHYISSAWRE